MATKEELEEQLEIARNDIAALAAMAGETARQKATNGVDYAREGMEGLSQETRELYERARREGAQLRRTAEHQVEQHPIATIGLAFAAGIAVAGLLGRR